MDQFPDTFNFNDSDIFKQKLRKINTIAELAKLREYVYGQYKKYMDKNLDYFVIDLTEHKHHARAIIIKELLPRFPDIGYASAVRDPPVLNHPPENELTVLELISPAHTGTQRKSYINRINPDQITPLSEQYDLDYIVQIIPLSEKYIIACTKEFAKEMTKYIIRYHNPHEDHDDT
jgi:hypothetical protein